MSHVEVHQRGNRVEIIFDGKPLIKDFSDEAFPRIFVKNFEKHLEKCGKECTDIHLKNPD